MQIRRIAERAKKLGRGVARPAFLRVPVSVLRLPGVSPWMALSLAAALFRAQNGWWLDFGTLSRWLPKMSRATKYRHLRKLGLYFDIDCRWRDEVWGRESDSWVRVELEDVDQHGPMHALVLGGLRNWIKRFDAQDDDDFDPRNGWFPAAAEEVGKLLGLNERTIRTALQALSTGRHKKYDATQNINPRVSLRPRRGQRTLVHLLTPKERTDFLNQRVAQANAERAKIVAKPAGDHNETKKAAVEVKQQSGEHGYFESAADVAKHTFPQFSSMKTFFAFLERLKKT